MSFAYISEIRVGLNFTADQIIPVGRLALNRGKIYFEYDRAFLTTGLELSPRHLPLRSGVIAFDNGLFEGLPGLFNDSLPDGWGRLLLDRFVKAQGYDSGLLTPLDRLAYVGHSGMGALVYEPDQSFTEDNDHVLNLDKLAAHAEEVMRGSSQDVLNELLALNGSSAGARPKAMIGVDYQKQNIIHGAYGSQPGYESWIVKFSNTQDGIDAGAIEYVYALMAKRAGIDMTDVHLFPGENSAGYFATKRFDRVEESRVHVHSVCGLLHSDFRTPALDYQDLLALTFALTRDVREVQKMYQLAVFNVLAHNRDDHSKNFSFVMSALGNWKLSPAYDLTFSSGPRGEQSMMVMNEGRNPDEQHLRALGLDAKLDNHFIDRVILQTVEAISSWEQLAREHGVMPENITLIKNRIASL